MSPLAGNNSENLEFTMRQQQYLQGDTIYILPTRRFPGSPWLIQERHIWKIAPFKILPHGGEIFRGCWETFSAVLARCTPCSKLLSRVFTGKPGVLRRCQQEKWACWFTMNMNSAYPLLYQGRGEREGGPKTHFSQIYRSPVVFKTLRWIRKA